MTREALDWYVRELRKGLTGVPRPDVDDVAEEIRSHLTDRIAEGDSPEQAIAGLGPASQVARESIQRRTRPEGGMPVPDASVGRRIAAWCADVVVGGALLLLNPAWFFVLGAVQERYWMTDEVRAQLAAMPEYVSMTTGVGWAILALLVGAAWAFFYWIQLRRSRSVSVGMRMAGISRVLTPDGVRVMRTSDIAEGEPAKITARAKWYLAAPIIPLAMIAILMMIELGAMTVGSFLQPFNPMLPASRAEVEHEDSQAVIEAFYDAVLAGDAAAADDYVAEGAAFDLEAFVADRREDGLESWEFSLGVPPNEWYVVETLDSGGQRSVLVTVQRAEEEQTPGDIEVRYRILRCSDNPLGDDVANPE
ncbi:MAG: hypothetical protein Q7J82_08730 [Coriobacteriia bacterium]|nr:hypothetical protein [Coriobacteriia bacterium]